MLDIFQCMMTVQHCGSHDITGRAIGLILPHAISTIISEESDVVDLPQVHTDIHVREFPCNTALRGGAVSVFEVLDQSVAHYPLVRTASGRGLAVPSISTTVVATVVATVVTTVVTTVVVTVSTGVIGTVSTGVVITVSTGVVIGTVATGVFISRRIVHVGRSVSRG